MHKGLMSAALICTLLGGNFTDSFAQNVNLEQKLPVDSKVKIGKLKNGLTYYIRENNKPEKKVELRLVLKAGSILETDQQQGLAHFMEHMNFNGLKHYPKNELISFLQSIGVKFGADLNANTGFDRTLYILPIPTDKPSNLDKGVQVLADWAQGALLTTEDINDERAVVLEESRLGKGANERFMKKALPELLAGSHYSDRLPIGKDSILKNFDPKVIRDYYHDWYRPDLMAVVIVGDVKPDEAEKLINKYFAGLTNPKNEKVRKYYEEVPYTSKKAMVLTDKEANAYDFSLYFSGKKVVPTTTLGDYKNDLIKNLFQIIMAKRFQALTSSANPPFVSAQTGIEGGLVQNYENFVLNVTPNKDQAASIKAAVAELLKAQQYGFNNTELDNVKKIISTYAESQYNERNTTESENFVDEYVDNFTDQSAIPGIEHEREYIKELLPTITVEDINAFAKSWIQPNANYFAMFTGPENGATTIKTDADLSNILNTSFSQTVSKDVEKVVPTTLLATQPTAGTIVKTEKDAALGATTYTLSNGVKVTVKSTDFKSDQIVFQGIKKGGLSNYSTTLDNKVNAFLGQNAGELMGYGKFDPTTLTDFLSGKKVSVSPVMGDATDVISGNSNNADLETMFQLLYLKMTQAQENDGLFNANIQQVKTQLEYYKANPQVAFIDTLGKFLTKSDPRRAIRIPSEEDLSRANPKTAVDIYNNEFANADGFHFFFVGNIDENKLKPFLEKYVASLPVKKASPNYLDNGLRRISGNNKLDFYKGSDDKGLIVDLYYGDAKYSNKLDLESDLVADAITIKINEILREKIGGIYSGSMIADFKRAPVQSFTVQAGLPCNPAKTDTLLSTLGLFIKDIKDNGPNATDLDKVKKAKIEEYKTGIKTNNYWLGTLSNVLFWGDDAKWYLDFEKNVNAVSAADLKSTAKMLFDANHFTGIMYPEKK